MLLYPSDSPAFPAELLFIYVIRPNRLDYLEYLVTNIKLVVKCRTDTTVFAFLSLIHI